MTLNKSKGNMYTFVTHTWNTVKGICPHGCSYCYMQRWGKLKPLRFDMKELKTDLGEGNFIFVGSSCDLFAEDIPAEWISSTLAYCREYDNSYLFQSKNPERMVKFSEFMPNRSVLCTTIETNRHYPKIMNNAPHPLKWVEAMEKSTRENYITIEPILDFDLQSLVEMVKRCAPVQVNIGADSGDNNLPEPDKNKIIDLIQELKQFTRIDQKRNLKRLMR